MDEHDQPRRGNPNWQSGDIPRGAKPFQAGQSGNPRGSSRRARLGTLLYEQLTEIVDGDAKRRTAAELVMRALIKEALRGNVRAAEICLDRIDGKLPQPVTNMTPDEAAETLAEMLGVDAKDLLPGGTEELE